MTAKKLSFFDGKITIRCRCVCNGKPTIRGQRITVQTILEFLSAGESDEEILRKYPTLTQEDIQVSLAFAEQLMNQEKGKWGAFADRMNGLTTPEITEYIQKIRLEMRDGFQLRDVHR